MNLPMSELRKAYFYRKVDVRKHVLVSILFSLTLSLVLALMFPAEGLVLKGFLFSMAFVVLLYFALGYPYLVYSQHRFIISSLGYMVLSDLSIITLFSSLFDACYHVYRSGYPIISSMFRDVVVSGLRGEDVSESIIRLADFQPSSSFKDGLLSVLLGCRTAGDDVVKTYGEAVDIYKSLTSQLETRFSVMMGLFFFSPIVGVIFSSIYIRDLFQVAALTAFLVILQSLIYVLLTRSLVRHRLV